MQAVLLHDALGSQPSAAHSLRPTAARTDNPRGGCDDGRP